MRTAFGMFFEPALALELRRQGRRLGMRREDVLRQNHAARCRERLEPGGDVHRISIEPLLFDHDQAAVDSDAEVQTRGSSGSAALASASQCWMAVAHATASLGALETGQEIVPDLVDHMSPVREDVLTHGSAVRLQRANRMLGVVGHESAVTHGIGAEDDALSGLESGRERQRVHD